jgi:hypothetical protein
MYRREILIYIKNTIKVLKYAMEKIWYFCSKSVRWEMYDSVLCESEILIIVHNNLLFICICPLDVFNLYPANVEYMVSC